MAPHFTTVSVEEEIVRWDKGETQTIPIIPPYRGGWQAQYKEDPASFFEACERYEVSPFWGEGGKKEPNIRVYFQTHIDENTQIYNTDPWYTTSIDFGFLVSDKEGTTFFFPIFFIHGETSYLSDVWGYAKRFCNMPYQFLIYRNLDPWVKYFKGAIYTYVPEKKD